MSFENDGKEIKTPKELYEAITMLVKFEGPCMWSWDSGDRDEAIQIAIRIRAENPSIESDVPTRHNVSAPVMQNWCINAQKEMDVAAAKSAEITQGATAEATQPQGKRDADKTKPVKELSKEAKQAYQLVCLMGKKQADAAKIMTEELNRSIKQGQISRWVKQVKKSYKANGLPVESAKSKPNIIPTDPDILNMGLRTDGKTTGDPRHKRR